MAILADVEINGTTTTVIVDTGAYSFGNFSEENTFQSKVEKLEQPEKVSTIYGVREVDFIARDVSLNAFGKQVKGDFFIGLFKMLLIIGMEFLSGAIISFFENGDWDIAFPARAQ